jgi:hypothetical protein
MTGQNANNDPEYHPDNKWYNWRPPDHARHYVEIVVLIAYVLFDAAELYPISHFLGILTAAALIAILGFPELTIGYWTASFIAIILAASALYVYVGPVLPEETNYKGWLVPANISTPLMKCPIANGDVALIMGTSVYVTDYPDRYPVFNLGECAPLHLHKTKDGVAVDFDMYTPTKSLIARLRDNEWHLVPSEMAYSEHPDRSTLQVIDKQGRELFFIKYLNPETIWIRGSFSCGTQQPIVIDNYSITALAKYFVMGTFMENIAPNPGPTIPIILTHSCVVSHFGGDVLDMENRKPSAFSQAFDRIKGWFQ